MISHRLGVILFLFCFFSSTVFGQLVSKQQLDLDNTSILGYSGFIYTPSAYVSQWGNIRFGASHYDSNTRFTSRGDLTNNERSFWANIGFLPFAELTIRLTKPYNSEKQFGLGDRSISFRGQILKENETRPAILFGVQDIFTQASFFSAIYGVATKTFDFGRLDFVGNIGYGFKRKNARKDILKGVFGGIQIKWQDVNWLCEYDADHLNMGLGYRFKKILAAKVALAQLKYLTGSITVQFSLK